MARSQRKESRGEVGNSVVARSQQKCRRTEAVPIGGKIKARSEHVAVLICLTKKAHIFPQRGTSCLPVSFSRVQGPDQAGKL